MILLGVNIDHCATVRQARYRAAAGQEGGAVEPDPVAFALVSERAGADGITVHLREDRRHIQERDVWRLREKITTRLNLEMACTPAMTEFALRLKPEFVCIVPENRQEVTTEGGLDIVGNRERVRACVDAMNAAGIKASLFIDPDEPQLEASATLGAPFVELHTGAYANAYFEPKRAAEFERLRAGAVFGHRAGLTINAGHGINYVNVAEVRTLPHLHELNIGHSIVSRALFAGVEKAVRDMRTLMNP
jgi:pyridoxine 5-phosphate synthase